MYTYTGVREMKVYAFKMDNGEEYSVLARTFAEACKLFDQYGLSGADILEMREYTPTVREAQ